MRQIILVIVLLLVVSCFFKERPSEIVISAIHDDQSVKFPLQDALVLHNVRIDTTKLMSRLGKNASLRIDSVKNYVTSELGKTVFLVKKKISDSLMDPTIILFGELEDSTNSLFLFDWCEVAFHWRASECTIVTIQEKDSLFIDINATMKSIGFALSSVLTFPMNDSDYFDEVERFLKVEASFSIPVVNHK